MSDPRILSKNVSQTFDIIIKRLGSRLEQVFYKMESSIEGVAWFVKYLLKISHSNSLSWPLSNAWMSVSLSCFVKDLHGRENEKRDCSHLQLDHIRLVAFLGYLSQLSPLQIRLCISRLRIFFLLFLETHALWVFQGQRPYWLLTNTYQNAMAIVEISIKPWVLWYRYPSSD